MALGWRDQYFRYKEYFLNIVSLYRQRADLRAFVEIILSISTITIFLVFALKPTALTIISLFQQIKEKQATLTSLNQKIDNLQKAQTVYAASQDQISNVDTAVATQPIPDIVTKQMVGLAAKDSVNILGLSVDEITLIGKKSSVKKTSEFKPLPGGAQEMQISISVQGDYSNLANFLSDFENLRIASKIDTVGMGSSVTNNQSVIVMSISGRVPFLGQQ